MPRRPTGTARGCEPRRGAVRAPMPIAPPRSPSATAPTPSPPHRYSDDPRWRHPAWRCCAAARRCSTACTGSCRRSLSSRRSSGNANRLIDHKLACELSDVSAYAVIVDAQADDGRRHRGALEFSTRRGGGEGLTVFDHTVTPRSEIDSLFARYIEDSLLDDIEPHLLAVVVARIVGEIAERSWRELSARTSRALRARPNT